MADFLTYEQFGAAGDGITDDMPAIVRTHAEANRLGLPVRARAGARYYISPKAATAEIRTCTDWTGAGTSTSPRERWTTSGTFAPGCWNARETIL